MCSKLAARERASPQICYCHICRDAHVCMNICLNVSEKMSDVWLGYMTA